jgi:NAD(P)-dependent dehydrogenase (short-subunit alcohol dehydrogenase family)
MADMPENKRTFQKLFDLSGRVALVAGGAGYLGSAICRGLMEYGAKVIIADINETQAERLADELNGMGVGQRSSAISLDASQEASIRRLIDLVRAEHQRMDILVNATCAPQKYSLEEISGSDFTESLSGNITGAFLLAREARRAMSAGGSMVLFSSMYGRVSPDPRIYIDPMRPNPVEYGASKAGIEQMVRYLAVAWAAEGIRVNGIAPGPFPNPQVREAWPDFIDRLSQKVPLGRIGRAGEIVGAVIFLASDAASYVTGHCLAIDGGWTIW